MPPPGTHRSDDSPNQSPEGWAAIAPWPRGVHAVFTPRSGGVSLPPWDSWNLGDHVGDDPQHVAANRLRLAQQVGGRPVFCRQVHGTDVLALAAHTPSGAEADGAWTRERGVACTMMVADCLPILVAAPHGGAVAALHAGWRGLAGHHGLGVLEVLASRCPDLRTLAQRREAVVWLGPCIGPQSFEVGPEVRQAFVATDPGAAACFAPVPAQSAQGSPPKFLAHLPGLARRRLAALGFAGVYGNDGGPAWCTVLNASRFFSHRRDQPRLGTTGRMAACIWLD